jgi:uridine kinase
MATMSGTNRLKSPEDFSGSLFDVMKSIHAGIADLMLYEFRYALENLLPQDGWESVQPESQAALEKLISRREYYESIQLKPRKGDRIVLDKQIEHLTSMLFVGLVERKYSKEWVKAYFYFDVRGFFFLPRTTYFTDAVLARLGGKPYKSFPQKQRRFEHFQGVGYKDFMKANAEIDHAFIESIKKIIAVRGTPILITLAGPTAAGKTEITERLVSEFEKMGRKVTTIEVDNFLLDRDYRENKGMGKESTHFEIFKRSLEEIVQGRRIAIPKYDFVNATSSHNLDGSLRPGFAPLEIEPADIIFMEGNFPFHIDEIARLIGLKVVYLTDDPIRLKRKWKRDIDYRKKYDPAYFRNRFFQTQFLRAEDIYRPLMQVCDMVVDTTHASLWTAPEIADILEG